MSTIPSILIWVLHVVCMNIYIFTFGEVYEVYSKLIYLVSCLIVLIFSIINILNGFKSNLHRAFICVCLASVAINFTLMIAYYLLGMSNYKWNFCIFNGIELITACFLLHSGNKNGLFTNETK